MLAGPRTLPPIPAVLLAIVSVQGGAAFAKELFPVLGSAGTAGARQPIKHGLPFPGRCGPTGAVSEFTDRR